MDKRDQERYYLHSLSPRYNRRLTEARKLVTQALACGLAYVALSGGKDSTVVLELVQEADPNIQAVWGDEQWHLPETLEYLERLEEAGIQLHRITTTAQHAEWFSVEGDWNHTSHYATRQGWQVVFLGLRQEENKTRRIHLRKYGPLFLAKSDGFWHCNPIHRWSVTDVWAYIVSQNIDYNRAYDKLAELGLPPERQRIGPLAVERVLGYGQLAILRRGWPDLFEAFAKAHPEARNYI